MPKKEEKKKRVPDSAVKGEEPRPLPSRLNRHFNTVAVFLIAVTTILIYSNSIHNSFHFDDRNSIVDNSYIRSLKNIPVFFQGEDGHTGRHRALSTTTFALNYYFGKLNVEGYHYVNISIHLLNGILVYFITSFLLGRLQGQADAPNRLIRLFSFSPSTQGVKNFISLFVALFYASHPIQINGVTYIVQRNGELMSLFYFLGFYLFMRAMATVGTRRILLFVGVALSFLLSIFSKENGFMLPFTLVVYDFMFHCDNRKALIKRLKIYSIPLIVFAIYLLFLLRGHGVLYAMKLTRPLKPGQWGPWQNLITQANVIVEYVKLLVLPLPSKMNVDHNFPLAQTLFEYPTLLSSVLISALLGLGIYLARGAKALAFAILWFFITLAPTSSVVPIEDIMVEYRLYLPMFGYCLFAVIVLYKFCSYLEGKTKVLVGGEG